MLKDIVTHSTTAFEADIHLLSEQDLQHLISAAKVESPRDLVILLLMAHAGLQLNEVTALNRSDIYIARNHLVVRGKRPRTLVLSKQLRTALQAWLIICPQDQEILLTTLKGEPKPMADRSIEALLTRLSEAAGLHDKLNARTLRTFYAVNLFRQGSTKAQIKGQLGITDEGTLNKYREIALTYGPLVKRPSTKRKSGDADDMDEDDVKPPAPDYYEEHDCVEEVCSENSFKNKIEAMSTRDRILFGASIAAGAIALFCIVKSLRNPD